MKLRIFGLVVLATAVSFASVRAEEVSPPASLAVVSGLLDGQIAVVKLSDGRVIKKAKEVEIGTEWTQWKIRGKSDRVPTAEVARVSLRTRRRTRDGAGLGMVVGFGWAVAEGSKDSCDATQSWCLAAGFGEAGLGVGGALLGGVVGAVVGTFFPKPGLEVYGGPLDQFLATHRQKESTLRYALSLPWPRTGSLITENIGTREREMKGVGP